VIKGAVGDLAEQVEEASRADVKPDAAPPPLGPAPSGHSNFLLAAGSEAYLRLNVVDTLVAVVEVLGGFDV
jgi:hypothetical protein